MSRISSFTIADLRVRREKHYTTALTYHEHGYTPSAVIRDRMVTEFDEIIGICELLNADPKFADAWQDARDPLAAADAEDEPSCDAPHPGVGFENAPPCHLSPGAHRDGMHHNPEGHTWPQTLTFETVSRECHECGQPATRFSRGQLWCEPCFLVHGAILNGTPADEGLDDAAVVAALSTNAGFGAFLTGHLPAHLAGLGTGPVGSDNPPAPPEFEDDPADRVPVADRQMEEVAVFRAGLTHFTVIGSQSGALCGATDGQRAFGRPEVDCPECEALLAAEPSEDDPDRSPEDGQRGTCITCAQPIAYIDSPHGGWWAHDVHPADGHDAAQPTQTTDTAGEADHA